MLAAMRDNNSAAVAPWLRLHVKMCGFWTSRTSGSGEPADCCVSASTSLSVGMLLASDKLYGVGVAEGLSMDGDGVGSWSGVVTCLSDPYRGTGG